MKKETIPFTIDGGSLSVLQSRVDSGAAVRKGFVYTIPTKWFDLARIGRLEHELQILGISYGRNDIYPAFKSEEELNAALLKVYNSGWPDSWAIKDYLVGKKLVENPAK